MKSCKSFGRYKKDKSGKTKFRTCHCSNSYHTYTKRLQSNLVLISMIKGFRARTNIENIISKIPIIENIEVIERQKTINKEILEKEEKESLYYDLILNESLDLETAYNLFLEKITFIGNEFINKNEDQILVDKLTKVLGKYNLLKS